MAIDATLIGRLGGGVEIVEFPQSTTVPTGSFAPIAEIEVTRPSLVCAVVTHTKTSSWHSSNPSTVGMTRPGDSAVYSRAYPPAPAGSPLSVAGFVQPGNVTINITRGGDSSYSVTNVHVAVIPTT